MTVGTRQPSRQPAESGAEPEARPGRTGDRAVSAGSAAVSAISIIAPKVCSRSCEVVSSPVTMWSETVQIASAVRPWAAASV